MTGGNIDELVPAFIKGKDLDEDCDVITLFAVGLLLLAFTLKKLSNPFTGAEVEISNDGKCDWDAEAAADKVNVAVGSTLDEIKVKPGQLDTIKTVISTA